MRLLVTLIVIVIVQAKKKRPPPINLQTKDASVVNLRKVDVYPDFFRQPVPFGHIFKSGMGDPKSDLKPPIDLLELDMTLPNDSKEAKKILQKDRMHVQIIRKEEPISFGNAKDEYLYKEEQKRKGQSTESENKNGTKLWFDWSSIHESNSAKRKTNHYMKKSKFKNTQVSLATENVEFNKKNYFAVDSFDLNSNRKEYFSNWSTCDDYKKATNFHPKDIINIDWVPFFVWSTKKYHVANVHRFSYPKKKLVKQYKDDFGRYLNKTIDWDQPKLVLKEVMELLLIAEDRIGLFTAIPHHEIPSLMKNKAIHIPIVSMRLKIVDPYLAIIYCDNQFASIMAVAGNEPKTDNEKISEAKVLKYRGRGYPVYRDLQMEKLRAQAGMMRDAEREESKFLTINEPKVRSHFLEKDQF